MRNSSEDDEDPLSPLGTITPTRQHRPDGQSFPNYREPRTLDKFHLERSGSSDTITTLSSISDGSLTPLAVLTQHDEVSAPSNERGEGDYYFSHRSSVDRTPLVTLASIELSESSDENQSARARATSSASMPPVTVELSESDEDQATARLRSVSMPPSPLPASRSVEPQSRPNHNPHPYAVITIPSERQRSEVPSTTTTSHATSSALHTVFHMPGSAADTPKPQHRRNPLSITLSDTSQIVSAVNLGTPLSGREASPMSQRQRRTLSETNVPFNQPSTLKPRRRGSNGSISGAGPSGVRESRKSFYAENLSPADAIASPRQDRGRTPSSFTTRLSVKSGEGGGLLEKMILDRQKSVSNLLERGKASGRSFSSAMEKPQLDKPVSRVVISKPGKGRSVISVSPDFNPVSKTQSGQTTPPRRTISHIEANDGSVHRSSLSKQRKSVTLDPSSTPGVGVELSEDDPSPVKRVSISYPRRSISKHGAAFLGVELSDDDMGPRQSFSKRRHSIVNSVKRGSVNSGSGFYAGTPPKRGSVNSMDGGYQGTPRQRRKSIASVDMAYPPTPPDSAEDDYPNRRNVRVSLSRSSIEPSRARRNSNSSGINYEGTPGSGVEEPRLVCSSESDDGAAVRPAWRGPDLQAHLRQNRRSDSSGPVYNSTASEGSVSFASSRSGRSKRQPKKGDLAERLAKADTSLFKWALGDYSRHFLPNVLEKLESSSASVQRRAIKCIKDFVIQKRGESIRPEQCITREDRDRVAVELDDVELNLYWILDSNSHRINPNWHIPAGDELFWFRFGLGEQVPIEILLEAVRAYDALRKGQLVWDEDNKKLFDRMLEVALAPADPCNVTWKEWTEFLLRFGPIEHCWEKASVLVNDGQKQRWFMPHIDKTAAEHLLKCDPNLHFILRTSKTKRDEPSLVLSHNAGGMPMHGEIRNDQQLGYSMIRESTVIYLLSLSEYLGKLSASMGWPKSSLSKTVPTPTPAVTDANALLAAVAKAEAACQANKRLNEADASPSEVANLLNQELSVGDPVTTLILRKDFGAQQPGAWVKELSVLLNKASTGAVGIALRKCIAEETVKLAWQTLPLSLNAVLAGQCPCQFLAPPPPVIFTRSLSQMYPPAPSPPVEPSISSLGPLHELSRVPSQPQLTQPIASHATISLQEAANTAKTAPWSSSLSELSANSESSGLLTGQVSTTPKPRKQMRKMFSFGGATVAPSSVTTPLPTSSSSSSGQPSPPSPTNVPFFARSTPTGNGSRAPAMLSRTHATSSSFFSNPSPKRQTSTPRLRPGKSDRTLPDFPPPERKSGSDSEPAAAGVDADEGMLAQGEKRVFAMLDTLVGLRNKVHSFEVFCAAAKWGHLELVLDLLKQERTHRPRLNVGSELKLDREKRRISDTTELSLLGNQPGQGNVLHFLASKDASVSRCLGDARVGSQRLFVKRRIQIVAAILDEERERKAAVSDETPSAMLEARGADDMTPLLRAARDQNTIMVDILLSHGASIHASDRMQQSIFHFALDWRRCCVELLFPKMLPGGSSTAQASKVDGGPQSAKYHPINKRSTDSDGRNGRSPLIMALESDREDKGVLVNMLLDYGAVLTGNPRNVGRPELLKILVDATNLGEHPEAALNPGAVRGFAILQNAVDRGDVDLVELMLSCPFNLPRLPQYYIEYKDVSLLRMAVRNPGLRSREIFELLVVKQADNAKKIRWPSVRLEKTESPLRVFPPERFMDARVALAAKIVVRKRDGANLPQKRGSIAFGSHDRLTFPAMYPLHAPTARHLPQFRYHFSPYAFLNSGDGEGFTPLMHAIYNTNRTVSSQIIERLLQMDVDIHLVDCRERNALHHACLANNRLAVELLLQAHVSTERRCIGNRTALHLAAEFGRWQILSALLKAGAKVDPWDEEGFTPLGRAMQRRKDLESPLVENLLSSQITRYLEDQETVVETLLQNQSSIRAATKFHQTDELLDWKRDFVKIFMLADGQTLSTTNRKRAAVAVQALNSRFVGSDEDASSEDESQFDPVQRKGIPTHAQLVQARIVEHNRQSIFQGKLNQVVINEAYEKEVTPRRGLAFLLYLVYLIVLTFVATFEVSNDQKSAHWFYSAMSNTLADGDNFQQINAKEDFWHWTQNNVMDVFYPEVETYYNSDGTIANRSSEYILGHIRLLGRPRLRQLRTWGKQCKNLDPLQLAHDPCFQPSGDGYEEANSFSVPCRDDEANVCLNFTWMSAEETGSTSYFSLLQTTSYPPGGYVSYFPKRTGTESAREEAKTWLQSLEDYKWIDTKTRAVFMEFNAYNPTRNHFVKATYIVEFSVTGKINPSFELQVARFARYDGITGWDNATAVFEALFCLASLWTISRDVKKMKQSRLDYFSNVGLGYAVLALLMLILFTSILALHIACAIKAERIDWSQELWVDLGDLGYWTAAEMDLLSLLVLVSWIRLLEFASVWRGFAKLTVIVEMMLGEVMSFLVVVGVVLWSFAIAIYVSHGYKTESSYSITMSLLSRTFEMVDGSSEDGSVYNRLLGPLYSVGFTLLLSVMLLNLLIAILTRAFDHATNDLGQAYWAQKQFVMVQQAMSTTRGATHIGGKMFWKLVKKIELWIRNLRSYPQLWAQHATTHISKHFEDAYEFTPLMMAVRAEDWAGVLQDFQQLTSAEQRQQLRKRDLADLNLLMHIAENCPTGNSDLPASLWALLEHIKAVKDGDNEEDTRHWQAKLLRARDQAGRTAWAIARARGCSRLVVFLEDWRRAVKRVEGGLKSFQEAQPPNFTSRVKSAIKRVQSSVPRLRLPQSPTFAHLEPSTVDPSISSAPQSAIELPRQTSGHYRIVIGDSSRSVAPS